MTSNNNIVDNTIEEDRPQATEQEEKDFEEYQKEVERQNAVIQSYEELIKRAENEDKLKDIKKWTNKLGEKHMNLDAQGPDARDRLGYSGNDYLEMFKAIHTDPDIFLGGDIDAQHKLLEILAVKEPEGVPTENLVRELQIFEYRLKKDQIIF